MQSNTYIGHLFRAINTDQKYNMLIKIPNRKYIPQHCYKNIIHPVSDTYGKIIFKKYLNTQG